MRPTTNASVGVSRRPWDQVGTRRRATTEAGDGRPRVIGRANGWPLEVRVWTSRPADEPDAIYHESGTWVSVRLLGVAPAQPAVVEDGPRLLLLG